MRLFDTHCHLDDERFGEDRNQLIQALPEQGLVYCVTVGSDIASSERSIGLAHQYGFLYAAAGLHPHEAAKAEKTWEERLRQLLGDEKAVALGEIGLDYYYDFSPRGLQKQVLLRQLHMAREMELPVILHVRDAHGDMIDMLRALGDGRPGGVLHCFSGSAESALEYVRMGFYISFAGPVTFKNAEKLLLAAKAVPLDRLLIETDSPYLAPVPMRGKRNDPSLIRHTCAKLAELRGMSEQEMADLTCENAIRFFGIGSALRSK